MRTNPILTNTENYAGTVSHLCARPWLTARACIAEEHEKEDTETLWNVVSKCLKALMMEGKKCRRDADALQGCSIVMA